QRMRELAVQAASDTNTQVDRAELQKEINELLDELDRIGNTTQFNTQNLLDGTFQDKKFHIGANSGQSISLSISDMRSGNIGGFAVYQSATDDPLTKTDFTDNGTETFTVTVDGERYTVTLNQNYDDFESVVAAINEQ